MKLPIIFYRALSEEAHFYFWLVPDHLEFVFFINFSISRDSFALWTDIWRNWFVTKTLIWYISKSFILQFSIKYKFDTRSRFNWSRAVFMQRFYLFYKKLLFFGQFTHFKKSSVLPSVHTTTCIYCVSEWNWRAPTMVLGAAYLSRLA